MRSTNKLVAQRFHGVLKIEKSGPHVFNLDLQREDYYAQDCKQVLTLDGEKVLEVNSENSNDYQIANNRRELEAGLYEISIWQICNFESRHNSITHNKINGSVKIKGPGEWEAKIVSADNLMHLQ